MSEAAANTKPEAKAGLRYVTQQRFTYKCDSQEAKAMKKRNQGGTSKVASIRQVLSFAPNRKVKLCIAGAFCCAFVSGAVYPGKNYESSIELDPGGGGLVFLCFQN